ncbi:MAG: hypothetical protein ABIR69_00990 [Nitrospiraceae bacterium]
MQIKNLVENLRSALDLAGRGLFDRYGSSSKASPKIYFPWPMGRAAGAALLTWTTDTPTVDDQNDECSGEVDKIEGEWAGPLEPPK